MAWGTSRKSSTLCLCLFCTMGLDETERKIQNFSKIITMLLYTWSLKYVHSWMKYDTWVYLLIIYVCIQCRNLESPPIPFNAAKIDYPKNLKKKRYKIVKNYCRNTWKEPEILSIFISVKKWTTFMFHPVNQIFHSIKRKKRNNLLLLKLFLKIVVIKCTYLCLFSKKSLKCELV